MSKRGNGEGTITKRPDGKWMAQITTGRDINSGKLIRQTKYFKIRKDAQIWLAEIVHKKRTGTYVHPDKTTLGEWIDIWLKTYVATRVRPNTYANYAHTYKMHILPEVGDIEMQKLQTHVLQQLYNKKYRKGRLDGKGGLSPRKVHEIHFLINGALKQAVQENLLSYNPAGATKLPPLKYKEITPLTREQVKKYLEAAKGERLYAAFVLELFTGLRRGELLGLMWDDIDFKEKVLHVRRSLSRVKFLDKGYSSLIFQEPKTQKGKRVIPLAEAVIRELEIHKKKQIEERLLLGSDYQNNNLIFCTPLGTPMEPRNLHRIHTDILTKAKIAHIRFHDLRHTFATQLLEQKEDPKVLQEILGHTKISTTYDIYCKVSSDIKANAILKLDKLLMGT